MAGVERLPELERCGWGEVLAALLALAGRRVELIVTAATCPWRQILAINGVLETGPEIGSGEDALIAVRVGEGCLALKRGWLERAWCGAGSSELALLFGGGVLVEIEPLAEPDGLVDAIPGPAARADGDGCRASAEGRGAPARGSCDVGACDATRLDARRRP